MNAIANNAASTTGYKLSKDNIVESTIYVKINGVFVPRDNQNGWKYNEAYNSIIFYGNSVPNEGDIITITYQYNK